MISSATFPEQKSLLKPSRASRVAQQTQVVENRPPFSQFGSAKCPQQGLLGWAALCRSTVRSDAELTNVRLCVLVLAGLRQHTGQGSDLHSQKLRHTVSTEGRRRPLGFAEVSVGNARQHVAQCTLKQVQTILLSV